MYLPQKGNNRCYNWEVGEKNFLQKNNAFKIWSIQNRTGAVAASGCSMLDSVNVVAFLSTPAVSYCMQTTLNICHLVLVQRLWIFIYNKLCNTNTNTSANTSRTTSTTTVSMNNIDKYDNMLILFCSFRFSRHFCYENTGCLQRNCLV